jgi:hypothetical protein
VLSLPMLPGGACSSGAEVLVVEGVVLLTFSLACAGSVWCVRLEGWHSVEHSCVDAASAAAVEQWVVALLYDSGPRCLSPVAVRPLNPCHGVGWS